VILFIGRAGALPDQEDIWASNKKDVEEQFVRHEHCCTLLRQQEVDEWVDVGLREIDTSPMLHHSMTSQV